MAGIKNLSIDLKASNGKSSRGAKKLKNSNLHKVLDQALRKM
jgi:hypothetical protein